METKKEAKDIISKLRLEASTNKAFNAIAHIFTLRERTRGQITISSLQATMIREGFSFSRAEYENVLKFLGSLGLGRLVFDNEGRIQALKDITITLQSIGYAAVAKNDTLNRFHLKPNYIDIIKRKEDPPTLAKIATVEKAFKNEEEKMANDSITITINGQNLSLNLPNGLKPTDLKDLIGEIFVRGMK